MTYVIAQPCVDVKDKACIEECPVDCIYEGERMLYIRPANTSTRRPRDRLSGRASSTTTTCPGSRPVHRRKGQISGQPGSPDGAKAGPLPHDTDYVASYFTGG